MKQAVILAAGEGQRLRPFTANRPKVMLPLAGKPILHYVIQSLAANNIRDIIVVVGYRRDQVFDSLGTGEQLGTKLTYVTQEKQLGTAHALLQAQDIVRDEFLVVSGDNLIEADTIARFASVTPNALLVKKVANPERYGVVNQQQGQVTRVKEKPRLPKSNLVSTGIYAFSKDIFNFMDAALDIPEVLNNMLARGGNVSCLETTATWLDASYPWDLLRLNDMAIRQAPSTLGGTIERGVTLKGPVAIEAGAKIRANCYLQGPMVIGRGCDIGPNVCIFASSSIGKNVVISPFTEIRNSIIADDVNIGPGCTIRDTIIGEGSILRGHFTTYGGRAEIKIHDEHHLVNIGAMIGEDCNIGNSVAAQPGTIVGNYVNIQPQKAIRGTIADRSSII